MERKIERLFRAPYSVPNALQVVEEGLWLVDQITDRMSLIEIAEPSEYGVTKLIRDIATESSNTSGLAIGEGYLWLAANGPGTLWRSLRETDANKGYGEVFQVDPTDGSTVQRYPIPGGGGVHGLEYDHFDPGHLWITTLKEQTLNKVRIADWSVHTNERVAVKLSVEDGTELDWVTVSEASPQPHGLSIYAGGFIYCDAASGWVASITL